MRWAAVQTHAAHVIEIADKRVELHLRQATIKEALQSVSGHTHSKRKEASAPAKAASKQRGQRTHNDPCWLCCVCAHGQFAVTLTHSHARAASLLAVCAPPSTLFMCSHTLSLLAPLLLFGLRGSLEFGGREGSREAGGARGEDQKGATRRGHTHTHNRKEDSEDATARGCSKLMQSLRCLRVRACVCQVTARAMEELAARRAENARLAASNVALEEQRAAAEQRRDQARTEWEARQAHQTQKQRADAERTQQVMGVMTQVNGLLRSAQAHKHTRRPHTYEWSSRDDRWLIDCCASSCVVPVVSDVSALQSAYTGSQLNQIVASYKQECDQSIASDTNTTQHNTHRGNSEARTLSAHWSRVLVRVCLCLSGLLELEVSQAELQRWCVRASLHRFAHLPSCVLLVLCVCACLGCGDSRVRC